MKHFSLFLAGSGTSDNSGIVSSGAFPVNQGQATTSNALNNNAQSSSGSGNGNYNNFAQNGGASNANANDNADSSGMSGGSSSSNNGL